MNDSRAIPTPTTNSVREAYKNLVHPQIAHLAGDAFDRWLAVVRADQAEKTLLEAAEDAKRYSWWGMAAYHWLKDRAVVLTPTTKETEQ